MATSRSKLIIDILTNDKATKTIVGLNQALELADKALQGMKKAFEFAEAGAQIEYTNDKLDRLATTIGSTGTSIRNNLNTSLEGLMSKTEGVALATDLMSLGLAKSEEDLIRLTTVASQLDMPMNDLILTLTNMRTMRFDQLNVAVDGFDQRLKTLEDTGLSTQEAFTEAFLQQAEEQIEKVGSAADSAIAPFKRVRSELKNLSDDAKMAANEGFAPLAESVADFLSETDKIRDAGDIIVEARKRGDISYWEAEWKALTLSGEEWIEFSQQFIEEAEKTNEVIQTGVTVGNEYAEFYEHLTDNTRDAIEANREINEELSIANALYESLNGNLDDEIAAMQEMAANGEDTTDALAAINQELSDMVLNTSVMNLLESGLEGAEQAAYELALDMGLIDQATYNANMTVANFNAYLADTEDIDVYGAAVAWMADNLDRLHDKTFTITQIIKTIGSYASGGYGGGGSMGSGDIGQMELALGKDINGNGIIGAENGFSGVVPPGYPNDSFIQTFALSSGEEVNITPSGQSASTVNFYITESSNARETARQIARELKLQGISL